MKKNKYMDLSIDKIIKKMESNDEILRKIWDEDPGGDWDGYCKKCQPYWDDNKLLHIAKSMLIDKKDIKFRPLEDWEKDDEWIHIIIEEFETWCKTGFVTSYDGYGYYATETEVSNLYALPYAFKDGFIRKDFTHVCWYNK